MEREGVGHGFDQFIPARFNESLHLDANLGVIDRATDFITRFIHLPSRPKRQVKSETLRNRAFLIGQADVSENLQLADVNPIVHAKRNLAETGPAANPKPRETLAGRFRRDKGTNRADWAA